MASRIKGPDVRIRRSDSLIAFGSRSPVSVLLGMLGGELIRFSIAGFFSGEDGVLGDDGLFSLPGLFVVDLVENSTLSGVEEDEIAA